MKKIEMAIISGFLEAKFEGQKDLLSEVAKLQACISNEDKMQIAIITGRLEAKTTDADAIGKIKSLQQLINSDSEDVKSNLLLTIEELDLSTRVYNCFVRAGYKTVADLMKLKSEEDALRRVHNLGIKSYDEMKDKLAQLGISWPSKEKKNQEVADSCETSLATKTKPIKMVIDDLTNKFRYENPSQEEVSEILKALWEMFDEGKCACKVSKFFNEILEKELLTPESFYVLHECLKPKISLKEIERRLPSMKIINFLVTMLESNIPEEIAKEILKDVIASTSMMNSMFVRGNLYPKLFAKYIYKFGCEGEVPDRYREVVEHHQTEK